MDHRVHRRAASRMGSLDGGSEKFCFEGTSNLIFREFSLFLGEVAPPHSVTNHDGSVVVCVLYFCFVFHAVMLSNKDSNASAYGSDVFLSSCFKAEYDGASIAVSSKVCVESRRRVVPL
jgi:hypothetical protein